MHKKCKQSKYDVNPHRANLKEAISLNLSSTVMANELQRKRGVSATIPSNFTQIPWGLNQERLKNYFQCELNKRENFNLNQQTRPSKSQENDRRKEIGLDFLNRIPKKKIQQLVQRQKKKDVNEFQHIHPKFSLSQHQQIQQFQKQKQQYHKKQKSFEQQKEIAQHQKIQQNLHNLVAFIKQSQTKIQNKKRSLTSIKQKQHLSKRNSNSRTKNQIPQLTVQEEELLEKYKLLQERYTKLFQSSYEESSCVQYVTDTDPDILPSKKTSEKFPMPYYDCSLDIEELNQLKEYGKIEKELNQMHQASILIQKIWRGYITRKNFENSCYQHYYQRKPEILNQETFRSSFQLDRISQSMQHGKEDTFEQLTHQTDLNLLLDFESGKKEIKSVKVNNKSIYDKFVKFQKLKWQEMLSYISNLQKEESKRDLIDVLHDLKQFTYQCSQVCSLSQIPTKQLEITVPQFSQESIVMSEIRQAMCSEKLIQQTLHSSDKGDQQNQSIFEQNSFQDFAANKINQLLNRDKMNQLLQIREKVIKERKLSEQEILLSQFNEKQISQRTFQNRNLRLEKWAIKQKKVISDQKTHFDKGWQGLYDTFINTEKDIKFLAQQQSLMNSQISQQFITYSVSQPSESELKICQGLSQQQDTFVISQSNEAIECPRMKTMISRSPSPFEKQQYIQEENKETIEWDDNYLILSEPCQNIQNGIINVNQLMEGAQNEIYSQAQSLKLTELFITSEIDLLHKELLEKNIDINNLPLCCLQKKKTESTNCLSQGKATIDSQLTECQKLSSQKQNEKIILQLQDKQFRLKSKYFQRNILNNEKANQSGKLNALNSVSNQEDLFHQYQSFINDNKYKLNCIAAISNSQLDQCYQDLLEILNQKWLNYEKEKKEVLLDLDRIVFEYLIEEIISDLYSKF